VPNEIIANEHLKAGPCAVFRIAFETTPAISIAISCYFYFPIQCFFIKASSEMNKGSSGFPASS